jgi:hypothetical protein
VVDDGGDGGGGGGGDNGGEGVAGLERESCRHPLNNPNDGHFQGCCGREGADDGGECGARAAIADCDHVDGDDSCHRRAIATAAAAAAAADNQRLAGG